MQEILQSSTAHPLVFVLYDSSDHVTGKTGVSPTVTISKNGASFASPSGMIGEIGNGFYIVSGNATDTNTLGMLALNATGSGCDQCTMGYLIVAYDPDAATNLGLSALPTASPGSANGVIVSGSNSDIQFGDFTVSGTTTFVLAANTITALSLKADAVTKIQAGLSTFAGGAVASVTGSVGSVTGLDASKIDANVSSRMATYTQPSGFLAATFPSTVASPTNITAGTITTVTNLTNAPTSGDFTAAMKTSLNAATPSVTVSNKTGFSLANGSIASATFAAGATIPRVTLSDTVTTYTGNTPQTRDVGKFKATYFSGPDQYVIWALNDSGDPISSGFTDNDRDTLEAIPRSGETNTYTNTVTAETATVAIT